VQSGPSSRAVRDGTRGGLARFTLGLSAARSRSCCAWTPTVRPVPAGMA